MQPSEQIVKTGMREGLIYETRQFTRSDGFVVAQLSSVPRDGEEPHVCYRGVAITPVTDPRTSQPLNIRHEGDIDKATSIEDAFRQLDDFVKKNGHEVQMKFNQEVLAKQIQDAASWSFRRPKIIEGTS